MRSCICFESAVLLEAHHHNSSCLLLKVEQAAQHSGVVLENYAGSTDMNIAAHTSQQLEAVLSQGVCCIRHLAQQAAHSLARRHSSSRQAGQVLEGYTHCKALETSLQGGERERTCRTQGKISRGQGNTKAAA
jgi:hypothetical protein